MQTATGISTSEFEQRRQSLLQYCHIAGLSGCVLFDQKYIQYFTGFNYLATERPVAFLATVAGELAVFVPGFEADRVRAETTFERIETYEEYPGDIHPMYVLGKVLIDMGLKDPLGADSDGYPGILGYSGPTLSEVSGGAVHVLGQYIEGLMVQKSEAEISLIRESAKWCSVAHSLLQRYSVPGVTETQASLRASQEATLAMMDTLGTAHGGQQSSSDGASAGYRGQIGKRSAWAHAVAHNIEFRDGDVLVSETSAPIWGYNAELERAMIIGQPSDEVRRLFNHAVNAQVTAFAALRPGATCGEVDRAVLRYFEQNDLLPYWRQHTGHGIGLRNHEAPFLDVGDHTPIEPGMVFTIEPGVYSPGVGGFRHSDTVVVRSDGIEILTDYPRDIESLTING